MALRQSGDGTKEGGFHSMDKALCLNPALHSVCVGGWAGRQRQGRDRKAIHRLWVVSHR